MDSKFKTKSDSFVHNIFNFFLNADDVVIQNVLNAKIAMPPGLSGIYKQCTKYDIKLLYYYHVSRYNISLCIEEYFFYWKYFH